MLMVVGGTQEGGGSTQERPTLDINVTSLKPQTEVTRTNKRAFLTEES
jgi:hypothetical protein